MLKGASQVQQNEMPFAPATLSRQKRAVLRISLLAPVDITLQQSKGASRLQS